MVMMCKIYIAPLSDSYSAKALYTIVDKILITSLSLNVDERISSLPLSNVSRYSTPCSLTGDSESAVIKLCIVVTL